MILENLWNSDTKHIIILLIFQFAMYHHLPPVHRLPTWVALSTFSFFIVTMMWVFFLNVRMTHHIKLIVHSHSIVNSMRSSFTNSKIIANHVSYRSTLICQSHNYLSMYCDFCDSSKMNVNQCELIARTWAAPQSHVKHEIQIYFMTNMLNSRNEKIKRKIPFA